MLRQVTPVQVQVDGDRFDGFYAVQSNMLTVWHAYLGSRTTQVDSGALEQQVDTLLIELARDSVRRRVPLSLGASSYGSGARAR